MPVAGGGFDQCYNAQAAVAAGSMLVVTADVVQAPNDKQQVEPTLEKLAALPQALGEVEAAQRGLEGGGVRGLEGAEAADERVLPGEEEDVGGHVPAPAQGGEGGGRAGDAGDPRPAVPDVGEDAAEVALAEPGAQVVEVQDGVAALARLVDRLGVGGGYS